MILKDYETVVVPKGLQLFEFARVGIELVPASDEISPFLQLHACVTLGSVLDLEAIKVTTSRFQLCQVREAKFVYRRWQWLRQKFGEDYQEPFLEALLKCMWYYRGLHVEFHLETTWCPCLAVRCSNVHLKALLPRHRGIEAYFGESRKIADTA